ncbi:hypothetical protein [Agromyces sp. NPDC058104]|uniref:hypothetical protein n=1 Tax=Agromyces sp. NPDC058104 TaxID=3346342 RepID=UPI0036DD2E67
MGSALERVQRDAVHERDRLRGHRQRGFLAGYLATRAGARDATLLGQAIAAQIRPTALLIHTQPNEPWDEHDFLLLEAWAILQAEICKQCHLPKYICHNESHDLVFDVMEDSCGAAAALHEREQANARNDVKLDAGVQLYVRPVLLSGGDPATLRDAYYESLAQQQAELAELESGS